MHYRVDDLDRSIIECLQESGRLSNTQIATRLGIGESTVRKRISRLLEHEVIRITAVANPLLLDYPIVAIIGVQVAPQEMDNVGKSLDAFPEFRFIGLTTGVYDFVAEAWFRSLDELRQFLTNRLMKVSGITRVETAHVLQMIRYTYDWGVDRRRASPTASAAENGVGADVLPLSPRRRASSPARRETPRKPGNRARTG